MIMRDGKYGRELKKLEKTYRDIYKQDKTYTMWVRNNVGEKSEPGMRHFFCYVARRDQRRARRAEEKAFMKTTQMGKGNGESKGGNPTTQPSLTAGRQMRPPPSCCAAVVALSYHIVNSSGTSSSDT